MTHLMICADDFGLSKAINRGILSLAEKGRITAISCMTQQSCWPSACDKLKSLDDVALGLHFDLTENSYPFSLSQLILKSTLKQLSLNNIHASFVQQLDAFEQALGRAPDFIDGHQHVHQFPGVRQVVIGEICRRYSEPERPWLRYSNPGLNNHDARAKALILHLISIGFKSLCDQKGLKTNSFFAGMYSLSALAEYDILMSAWLAHNKDQALLMCHPAMFKAHESESDPLRIVRQKEFDFLNSDRFLQYLSDYSIRLTHRIFAE